MAINYVHPSVSSTITDNSTVYITASGTTKLFAVFTSEKGVDNKIQTITSVSEFVFNYGEPNMKLYGQAGYNIVNWLNSGGSVYCLRVLPEDAGYANAIVNIQSKVSTKEVLKDNGETVRVNNVELRPCVTYTKNNATKNSIEIDAFKNSSLTVDGYKNNMLFAVIPKGRGAGYNDLGFRISLEDAYDSTYEFRLYNFEVTKKSESGNISTIQGPFLVSLDPDAMSLSGSSLFIVDVIDRYCDYLSVIFNEDAYVALANEINPNVHPNRIDFFNGISRRIADDEYETFDNTEVTGRYEDVHMSLVKYIDGKATTIRNIVDPTDIIEGDIVKIDNSFRNGILETTKQRFEREKAVLDVIKKGSGKNGYESIVLDEFEASTIGSYTVEDYATKYSTFESTLTSTDMDALEVSVEKTLVQLHELYDYAAISGGMNEKYGRETLEISSNFNVIETTIKQISAFAQRTAQYKNTISNLKAEFKNIDDKNTDAKLELITVFKDELDEIYNGLYKNSDISEGGNTFADKALETIKAYLETIKSNYETIIYKYSNNSQKENALNACWTVVSTLLNISNTELADAMELVLLELKASVYKAVKTKLDSVKSNVTTLVSNVANDIDGFSFELALDAVEILENDIDLGKYNSYRTKLQDFESYIILDEGTDGAIEGKLFNDTEVEKLIINGYTGSIDNTLIDKDQWPIDMVLDANYSTPIKNAIAKLCSEYRDDFMGILDTGFRADPEEAISYRKNDLNVNNFRLAIFTQDFIVADAQYTGNNIQVTPTYFLASKIPANDDTSGIHWNFVGPRRGTIAGYKSISFLPNPEWRERLYNSQVNYVQQDQVSTRFGSQLTSQSTISALSNISCVRTLLRIQRDVENLMKNYQFEFNDDVTITNAQTALNAYLNQWLSNRACDSITGSVYASDYDRQQKLLRVKIELVFNSIIERIAIDLIVNA